MTDDFAVQDVFNESYLVFSSQNSVITILCF